MLRAVLGWILHLAEQQVFAGSNSDTWMHTVRLLIRDSASPLSPHLGRRGDARRHTLAVALTRARARPPFQIRMHSRWQHIRRTNQSRQSQKRFGPQHSGPDWKVVVDLPKSTIVFSTRLVLFADVAPLRHFCRDV